MPSQTPTKHCAYLHRFLYYDPDGGLKPCCFEFVPEVGNLKDGTIGELFTGPKLAALARRFASDDPDPSCAACPKWARVPEHAIYPFDATVRGSEVHAG